MKKFVKDNLKWIIVGVFLNWKLAALIAIVLLLND